MKISVAFGSPLAGKSTYIDERPEKFNHISVGKICREEANVDSERGRLVAESIKNNSPLKSDDLIRLIFERTSLCGAKENIIDGYPKYDYEVEPLIEYLNTNGMSPYASYLFDVPFQILKERLLVRYTCSNCYSSLKENKKCICGGHPFIREEDSLSYFMGRYQRYEKHKETVIWKLRNYFRHLIYVNVR